MSPNLVNIFVTYFAVTNFGDHFGTIFGEPPIWCLFCHKICHQTWWSPNLTPNWVTYSSQNLAITKFITKSSTNFCENLVNNLLTLFSDIFLTEFFDHQICHLILHQIWCSPNLVTNLSPNLVTKLVITIFDTLFGDKFVTKFGEHQICHQITHQIWWQIYHQNGCSLILSPNLSPYSSQNWRIINLFGLLSFKSLTDPQLLNVRFIIRQIYLTGVVWLDFEEF